MVGQYQMVSQINEHGLLFLKLQRTQDISVKQPLMTNDSGFDEEIQLLYLQILGVKVFLWMQILDLMFSMGEHEVVL